MFTKLNFENQVTVKTAVIVAKQKLNLKLAWIRFFSIIIYFSLYVNALLKSKTFYALSVVDDLMWFAGVLGIDINLFC